MSPVLGAYVNGGYSEEIRLVIDEGLLIVAMMWVLRQGG